MKTIYRKIYRADERYDSHRVATNMSKIYRDDKIGRSFWYLHTGIDDKGEYDVFISHGDAHHGEPTRLDEIALHCAAIVTPKLRNVPARDFHAAVAAAAYDLAEAILAEGDRRQREYEGF